MLSIAGRKPEILLPEEETALFRAAWKNKHRPYLRSLGHRNLEAAMERQSSQAALRSQETSSNVEPRGQATLDHSATDEPNRIGRPVILEPGEALQLVADLTGGRDCEGILSRIIDAYNWHCYY